MFQPKPILEFLSKLRDNNNKVWLDANRDEYQAVRAEWLKFTEYLLGELGDVYPNFYGQDPRKCIYRINRDVRFSHNKAPYKNNLGAYLIPAGKKSGNAGFYIRLEPGNSYLAAGLYGPSPIELKRVREYLLAHHQTLTNILEHPNITANFKSGLQDFKLKTHPRGFDPTHPAIEFLRQKHFMIVQHLPDKIVLNKNFEQKVNQRFHYLADLVDYFNQALLS